MNSLAARSVTPHGYSAILLALPLLALLATLWPSLHSAWLADTYSHGYLVLGISLWLCLREFRRAPVGSFAPSLVAIPLLALVLLAAVLGSATDTALLQQLSVPAIPIAALWAVGGWAIAKRFMMPAAYMSFAMPVWESINGALQGMTVFVVGRLTRMSSIPAFIEGNFIRVPSGTFEIAGGCSGLHYLIVACALGTLYGLLNFERWVSRIAVLLCAAALALLANWIRVFVIVVAGHATEMQHYLVTVDHYYFGWVLFFVVLTPLFVFGRRLDIGVAQRSASAPEAKPVDVRPGRSVGVSVALTGVLLTAGAWLSFQAGARSETPVAGGSFTLPSEVGGWRFVGDWNAVTRPEFVNTDREADGWYGREADRVSVYVAHYLVQDQGKEAVYFANLPAGRRSVVVGRAAVNVGVATEETLPLTELVVEDGRDRRVVWYGYRIAGRLTGNDLVAKLYQGLGAFQGRWDAQAIVMSRVCETDCGGARETLALFASDAAVPLLEFVRGDEEY